MDPASRLKYTLLGQVGLRRFTSGIFAESHPPSGRVGRRPGRVTLPTKVAGTLRRAVRWSEFTMIPGERHMECAYYFGD